MSQVTVWRPFTELDLRDQLRLHPYAVFHFPASVLRRLSPSRATSRRRTQARADPGGMPRHGPTDRRWSRHIEILSVRLSPAAAPHWNAKRKHDQHNEQSA